MDAASNEPSTENAGLVLMWRVAAMDVAVIAGVLASYAGLHPTGEPHDRVLVGVVVGLAAWAAGTAPLWLITVWCSAVTAFSLGDNTLVTVVLLAAVGVLLIPRFDHPITRQVGAAASLVGSAHLVPLGRFGNTTLMAVLMATSAVVFGIASRPKTVRRTILLVAAPLLFWTVASAVASGAALLQARNQLADAEEQLRATVDALRDGDFDTARETAGAARDAAEGARQVAGERFSWLGRYVPVVAQHRHAADAVVTNTALLLRDVDRVLEQLPRGRLNGSSGRINIGEITALSDTVQELTATVRTTAAETVTATESPWLYGSMQRQLHSLADELTAREDDLDRFGRTLAAVPGLLGEGEPRRYLLIFITPSEARSLGGFMGSYATLTANDGLIQLERVGRTLDLSTIADQRPEALIIDGPPAYVQRYAPFGTGGGTEPANRFWWSRFTLSPDFPSVAEVAASLYTKATGEPLSGVLSVDPHGLAGLLRITGPITLPSIDRELTADDAEQFLSIEQYLLIPDVGNDARVELLGEAAELTFSALFATPELDLSTLIAALRPEIDGRHLMAWSPDPDEQAVFTDARLDGAFELPAGDALAVTNNNSSGNKIDIFLDRTIVYEALYDPATGKFSATVEITLVNESPAEGLPDYIIGNVVGDSWGTNRSYIHTYFPHTLTSISLDGTRLTVEAPGVGQELGWNYVDWQVVIPPGGTSVLRYQLEGSLPTDQPYRFTYRAQPTARGDHLTVRVEDPAGNNLVTFVGDTRTDLVLASAP